MANQKITNIKNVPGLFYFINRHNQKEYIAKVKINGKIKQCNLTKKYLAHNKEVAKKSLELFKEEVRGHKVVRGDKITLNTFFYDTYIVEKSKTLQKEYTSYYECHIQDRFGHFALSDIPRTHIQEEINGMYNIVLEGGSNYSNRTVQKYQQILRNIFNVAIKKNILEDNQATLLTIKEVNNERDLYFIIKGDLTIAIKKLLEQIDKIENHKYRLCLLMTAFSGRRIEEILQLKYIDIDFSTNFILSRKEKKKNKRKSSLVFLNDELIAEINTLKEDNKDDIYIFQSNKTEKPYNYTTILKQNKKVIGNTNIQFYENEDLQIHDYRHFFGQIMRKQIKDFLLIKMVLDHTDKDITTRYSQYAPKDSKKVLKKYWKILRKNN